MKKYKFLILIILLGFCLRFFNLNRDLFFGFEQGRDFLRIQKLVKLQDLYLVGPKTDIDGVFHGAWYYYLLAPIFILVGGQPLGISLFLVLLSLIIPIVFYQIFKLELGEKWGLLAALLAAINFELISYARWLSNVSPALPLLMLAFYSFYKFYKLKKIKYWYLGILLAAFSAQFQIILTLWWVFILSVWLLTKFFKLNFKQLLISWLIFIFPYLPFILFNLKNNFITLISVKAYLFNHEGGGFNLLANGLAYLKILFRIFSSSLYFNETSRLLAGLILLTVFLWGIYLSLKNKKTNYLSRFFLSFILMTLPVILFAKSLGLLQLYLTVSLGLVGLTTLGIYSLLHIGNKFSKFLVGVVLVLLFMAFGKTLQALMTNQYAFFVTIQDDLNLHDQMNLINYIISDAGNQPYRLEAFTIPYFQPQGWQYLHEQKNPQHSDQNAKLIYVIIEAHIPPFWEFTWINDLGETKLIEEKQFGMLRVQKRAI